MEPVRILADDLTGALDSAGCFVGAGRTLPLIFHAASIPQSGSCAFSTETRDVPESEVLARLTAYRPAFDAFDGVAFKKIDSLLRGHVAAEIAHIVRHNQFNAAVLAPAFPALGRLTRAGRQWAKFADGAAFRRVGPDLVEEFARFGMEVRTDLSGLLAAGAPHVVLCDAESDDDLRRIVDLGAGLGRVLWCGSAGLAEAIAGDIKTLTLAARRLLVICGTRHPVAALQIKKLCDDEPSALASLSPGFNAAAAARIVNERLRNGMWAALAVDFPDLPAAQARSLLENTLNDVLPRIERPDAAIVMGGDTLAVCNDVLRARRLTVRGLLSRGIAVSEFTDGAWASMPVISKSGAFGSEDTLRQIVDLTGACRPADYSTPVQRPSFGQ